MISLVLILNDLQPPNIWISKTFFLICIFLSIVLKLFTEGYSSIVSSLMACSLSLIKTKLADLLKMGNMCNLSTLEIISPNLSKRKKKGVFNSTEKSIFARTCSLIQLL
ncbi:hypothetical protein MANES_05G181801v8 [Manihot esculenta]|uniref:Uncharacterized protein n=1 Tax=Manihot esculenta TaxID=3983 RepID=A0ACB7HQN9_MANES|nr:hypothetical protein MANES_05G181801v8 [Manihot esculenta]